MFLCDKFNLDVFCWFIVNSKSFFFFPRSFELFSFIMSQTSSSWVQQPLKERENRRVVLHCKGRRGSQMSNAVLTRTRCISFATAWVHCNTAFFSVGWWLCLLYIQWKHTRHETERDNSFTFAEGSFVTISVVSLTVHNQKSGCLMFYQRQLGGCLCMCLLYCVCVCVCVWANVSASKFFHILNSVYVSVKKGKWRAGGRAALFRS